MNNFLHIKHKQSYRTGEFALTPTNVDRFFEYVSDLHRLGLFQLAISGGIRREDIVAIKNDDIDVIGKKVSFNESKKKRIKTIPVSTTMINTLQMVMKINKQTNAVYLFPRKKDSKKHISGRTAYNWFQEQLTLAGLKKRPFHALRATCVKQCQAKGWTITQTAELIGDTINVVQKHYAAPSDDEMSALAEEKAII